jgi:hypothetical protein
LLSDKIPNIEMSLQEYPIISFNQYLDIIENRPISNTWYFILRMLDTKKHKKVSIIFYFERFFPAIKTKKFYIDEYGKRKYKFVSKKISSPLIKLYASVRQGGHTKKLDDKIDFVNVGMLGDKMVVGVKNENKRNYVESKETHLASPIIRKLIDQLLDVYLDIKV